MSKLSNLKPKLGGLSSRMGQVSRDEAERSRVRRQDPMFRLYGTARWKALRQRVLVRDNYTCARCRRIAVGKGQAAVDHVKPHRRDEKLFWDETNLQCLCKPCHDGVKQREEQSDIKGVWY